MTCTSGVGVPRPRPSGPGSRDIPTPRPGRPPLRPSPTAPCMRLALCQWRLAEALLSTGDREHATVAARAAYQTAVRLGAEPLRSALEALARRGRLDLGAG